MAFSAGDTKGTRGVKLTLSVISQPPGTAFATLSCCQMRLIQDEETSKNLIL